MPIGPVRNVQKQVLLYNSCQKTMHCNAVCLAQPEIQSMFFHPHTLNQMGFSSALSLGHFFVNFRRKKYSAAMHTVKSCYVEAFWQTGM